MKKILAKWGEGLEYKVRETGREKGEGERASENEREMGRGWKSLSFPLLFYPLLLSSSIRCLCSCACSMLFAQQACGTGVETVGNKVKRRTDQGYHGCCGNIYRGSFLNIGHSFCWHAHTHTHTRWLIYTSTHIG